MLSATMQFVSREMAFDAKINSRRLDCQQRFNLNSGIRPLPLKRVVYAINSAEIRRLKKLKHVSLIEEFSDFRKEDQLTLPHTYAIHLTIKAQSTRSVDWVLTFSQFAFNQPIDAKAFNVAVSN